MNHLRSLEKTLDTGSHINAGPERRGLTHPKPLTEPPTHKAPLSSRRLQCVVRWFVCGSLHAGASL